MSLSQIRNFVVSCHKKKVEAWIAGSITLDQLPFLWRTNVDVICVRGAACKSNTRKRFGAISKKLVGDLVKTIHIQG